ncbi:MAG: carbon-nitrogen hydrolase [Brevinematales bacterium]|nr:carbon-nitrogen hydrolase [Brevinematales bacterium]
MKDKISVALIQNSYEESVEKNIDKNISKIKEAQKMGADFVSLSELHNSLYFCQREDTEFFKLAEEIPGKSTEIYGRLSKELNITLLVSLFEKRARGIFHNTALILDRGEIAGLYRKMHIPDDPGFYEKFYFTPGDIGFEPIETSLGTIGVLICWDQWFPEAARIMCLKGAELLVYPTAIGWAPSDPTEEKSRQLEAWINIQRSHAIANGVFVLSVNRTGNEKINNDEGIDFWGNSFICGPQGEIVKKANSEETITFAEIDKERIDKVRQIWPFFRDRRIDEYEDILNRFF